MEIWESNNHGAWTKLTLNNSTSFNTYNNGGVNTNRSYPRIGIYKWTTTSQGWTGSGPSLSFYMSRLYFGQGTDLLENAKASLANL